VAKKIRVTPRTMVMAIINMMPTTGEIAFSSFIVSYIQIESVFTISLYYSKINMSVKFKRFCNHSVLIRSKNEIRCYKS